MGQSVRQSTIVCQQDQPFRVCIQPTHRKHILAGEAQDIEYRASLERILPARDNTRRLVQYQVNFLGYLVDPNAIHLDVVLTWKYLLPDLGDLAVDEYAALPDPLLGLAAGADPRIRNELLNANLSGGGIGGGGPEVASGRFVSWGAGLPRSLFCHTPPLNALCARGQSQPKRTVATVGDVT